MGNLNSKIHPVTTTTPVVLQKQVKTLLDAYQDVIPGSSAKQRTSRQRRGSFFTILDENVAPSNNSPRFKTNEMIRALSDFEEDDIDMDKTQRMKFFST